MLAVEVTVLRKRKMTYQEPVNFRDAITNYSAMKFGISTIDCVAFIDVSVTTVALGIMRLVVAEVFCSNLRCFVGFEALSTRSCVNNCLSGLD